MYNKCLPKIIAHRGASGDAPENTLLAIETAKNMGAHAVEIDVCLTKDKQPVITHYHHLSKIFSKQEYVYNINYAELKSYNASMSFSQDFPETHVPHLVEVIELCQNLSLMLDIELKPINNNEKILAKVVNDAVLECWQKKNAVWITSFSVEVLCCMYTINPKISLGLIVDEPKHDLAKTFKETNAKMLVVNADKLTKQQLMEFNKITNEVYAYTVNTKDRADELFSAGIKGVFTDYLSEFYDS